MNFYDIPLVIAFKDVINFFKFKKDIKDEEFNRNSRFNKFKLHHNWLGNIIYFQINCTEDELAHFDYNPERMIMYKINPIVEYMTDLGWSEYLIPQINNFVDSEGKMSLSYGILFVFTPFKFKISKLVT